MSLSINISDNTNDMFNQAALGFVSSLEHSLHKKNFFDVALSGGKTAQEFFTFLFNALKNHRNLKKIRFFFSDERVVSVDSPESNAGNAWRLLCNPLAVDRSQFFPMYDGIHSPHVCANTYQQLLETKLSKNAHGISTFDVVFLGIGQDGHTASLFPHSKLLSQDGLVRATAEKNIAYERITLMPKIINSAIQVCVMANGQSKAAIIRDIISGPLKKDLLPAQLILREPKTEIVLFLADMSDIRSL
jgi:6-phosphogluconolactonase